MRTILRNRTQFNTKLLILLLLLSMISCSDNSIVETKHKSIQVQTEPTVINFIGHWLGEGDREKFVRNIVREYEFKNQHVKINLQFPEEVYYDRSDFKSNQRFVANIINQENPKWDIIRINGQYSEVIEFTNDPDWPRKNLVDFSEIEEFKDNTLDELLSEKSKLLWNGIIPGPVIEGQYWALWFNKKVAEKVNIDIKQHGMTIDDFLYYLEKVEDYNKANPEDKINLIFNSPDWPTAYVIGIHLFASSFEKSDDFFKTDNLNKRLDAWSKTLSVVEKMAKFKPFASNWKELSWGNTTNNLLEGECLFYINGSWMYNIWRSIDELKTLDCFPAELPVFQTSQLYPSNYNVSWGVLKNSPNKEEAIKFLLAINEPSTAETWVNHTKCPSGIKGRLTNVDFGNDQFEDFSFNIQKNYKDKTYKMNENGSGILFGVRYNSINNYFHEVITGDITAREAMRKIRSAL